MRLQPGDRMRRAEEPSVEEVPHILPNLRVPLRERLLDQGTRMNALIVTPKGIAVLMVEDPAPPRLEIYVPVKDDVQYPWSAPPRHIGYINRGPGQLEWAIYEAEG